MRPTPLLAAIAALALVAACSQGDSHRAGEDLNGAGRAAGAAAQDLAHNSDVKNAEAGFKKAGHEAAQDARKLAAQAKVEAHKLAADTRQAAHGVSKRDRADDSSS